MKLDQILNKAQFYKAKNMGLESLQTGFYDFCKEYLQEIEKMDRSDRKFIVRKILKIFKQTEIEVVKLYMILSGVTENFMSEQDWDEIKKSLEQSSL